MPNVVLDAAGTPSRGVRADETVREQITRDRPGRDQVLAGTPVAASIQLNSPAPVRQGVPASERDTGHQEPFSLRSGLAVSCCPP